MQIQTKQQERREEKFIFYAKGSGSSACLLTKKLDDEPQFIQFQTKGILIKQVDIAGLYIMAIVQTQQVKQSANVTQKQQEKKVQQSQNKIMVVQQNDNDGKYIKKQEKVAYWGNLNDKLLHQPQILQMPANILVESISCGWNHSLIKSKNGLLFGFGQNKFGQIGIQNPNKLYVQPVLVIPSQNADCFVDAFKAGFRQSYWQTFKKVIYGCGQSKNYELGQSKKKNLLPATIIQVAQKQRGAFKKWRVAKINVGKRFVMIKLENNQLYGLGSNDYCCLSSENNVNYLQKITFVRDNVKDVECGWNHVVVQDMQGVVYTKGRNNFGQLGTSQNSVDNRIQLHEKCSQIAAGTQFNFAKGQSGRLYGWGWNEHLNVDTDPTNAIIQKPKVIKIPQKFEINKIYTHSAITIIKGTHYN